MTGRRVHMDHLALASKDVAQTSLVFEVLGHQRVDLSVGRDTPPRTGFLLGCAETVILPLEYLDPGSQAGVRHVALGVADLRSEVQAGERLGFVRAGEQRRGVEGAAEVAFLPESTGNVRIVLTDRTIEARAEPSAIDHLGVASIDNDAIANVFIGHFGLPLNSIETTVETTTHTRVLTSSQYGTSTHAYPPKVLATGSTMFIDLGMGELECTCDTTPPSEQSDSGKRIDVGEFTRFIRARGPGLHHIAVRTNSIMRDMENLTRAGVELIDRVPRIGARSSQISFIHPRSAGGVLMHLVERPD